MDGCTWASVNWIKKWSNKSVKIVAIKTVKRSENLWNLSRPKDEQQERVRQDQQSVMLRDISEYLNIQALLKRVFILKKQHKRRKKEIKKIKKEEDKKRAATSTSVAVISKCVVGCCTVTMVYSTHNQGIWKP